MPKTKIICTIGPSSNSVTVLRNLMLSGMDVARLNFSHGTPGEHAMRIRLIRELNRKYRRRIGILQDLEGYRIRLGSFSGRREIELRKKQAVTLCKRMQEGQNDAVPLDYEGELSDIKAGSHIFIDDGNIDLLVKSASPKRIRAEVVIPGMLKEHKGINIPELKLKFKGLTDKDRLDVEFGIRHKVDYIAQSFVRSKEDVILIKELIKKKLPDCRIIAKIENRDGIKNIDEIIGESDGVMVARGDMGVSLPIYEIPVIQKEIVRKCNRAGKFVITATQMLESMTSHVRPTRAEVTDVANAILDGSNYVMLSAETAAGKYPVETVKLMNRIINFTEESILLGRI